MFGGDEFGPGPAFAGYGHGHGRGPRRDDDWQPWARQERPFGPPFRPFFEPPILRMARRFFFGPGGPGGPGMGPRMFGRGDLKYALLEALRERPKHGYEMMKELEERAGGFYMPSAGAVYPTLQLLEDRGWVTSESVEGKRVYTITDAGKQALVEFHERRESFGPRGPWEHHGHGHHHEHGPFGQARPELRALRHETMEVARLMRAAVLASDGDPARLERLRAIVQRTRGDLDEFLGQRRSESAPSESGEGQSTGETGPVQQV
ncbi:MAG TPA: PadR family transcriptional regulator [Ktedonobacterales bacterium]|nr:PadR family transcriptional regulator [Ktedonobacterales bacterium]